ncbi:hypothetical protein [Neisseria meningitidis]|uniref:hypothetical protein n=1 Tax=Neisseria meningitidis TaxID=487 RepID=UPI003F790FA4
MLHILAISLPNKKAPTAADALSFTGSPIFYPRAAPVWLGLFCLEGKWLKYVALCSVSLFTASAPLSALKQVDTAMNRRKENAV